MKRPELLPTEVRGLDHILGGGFPVYTCHLIAGAPGAGKTILAQQIAFNAVARDPEAKVLYLTTVSEPTPKMVRFMQQFSFFKPELFATRIVFADVGQSLRELSLEQGIDAIMGLVTRHKPTLLVIDSFRAIRDLRDGGHAAGENFRLFCFDLVARLSGARCTTLLVGEYDRDDLPVDAEFAVADGILFLELNDYFGERQRTIEVAKLRGHAVDLRPFPFVISTDGIRVLGLELTAPLTEVTPTRNVQTGIYGLDEMLGGGIPSGRAVLLSGESGTGKTTLAAQFIAAGAAAGERCLFVTFEESPTRLRELSEGFGWDMAKWEKDGLLRIVHVPQVNVSLMPNIDQLFTLVDQFRPERIVVDSLSVFLHRVSEPGVQRDIAYRMMMLVRGVNATGLLISDVPNDAESRLSRFGVEETVADGVVALSVSPGAFGQRRYLQIHKMRARRHVTSPRRMAILAHGIEIFYERPERLPQSVDSLKLAFPAIAPVIDSTIPQGLSWLVRGASGSGKTSLAQQFAMDGLTRGESVLYVSADAPEFQVRREMQIHGFDIDPFQREGRLQILSLESDPSDFDLSDPEGLIYDLGRRLKALKGPTRMVIDSLWPLATGLSADQFVSFVRQKITLLRRPDVTIFDTKLLETLDARNHRRLENTFDVILDLERKSHRPTDASEAYSGEPSRGLQFDAIVTKARGMTLSNSVAHLEAVPGEGIKVRPSWVEEFHQGEQRESF